MRKTRKLRERRVEARAIYTIIVFSSFMLFSGAYQEDCRSLTWNTQIGETEISFPDDVSSGKQSLYSQSIVVRTGSWQGDNSSRLIFYSGFLSSSAGGVTAKRMTTPSSATTPTEFHQRRLAYELPYTMEELVQGQVGGCMNGVLPGCWDMG